MEIHVTLVGSLRDKLPKQAKGKTTLTVPEGSSVMDVVRTLQLSTTVMAAIGGETVDKSRPLQAGEEIQFMRMAGGG